MPIDAESAEAFVQRLNAVEKLESTSNQKFQVFRDWLTEELGRAANPSYLSSLSRQFKARVGTQGGWGRSETFGSHQLSWLACRLDASFG